MVSAAFAKAKKSQKTNLGGACGADPHIIYGVCDQNGVPKNPGERWLGTRTIYVDWDLYPERARNEGFDEIEAIPVSMGRDMRQAVAS